MKTFVNDSQGEKKSIFLKAVLFFSFFKKWVFVLFLLGIYLVN